MLKRLYKFIHERINLMFQVSAGIMSLYILFVLYAWRVGHPII